MTPNNVPMAPALFGLGVVSNGSDTSTQRKTYRISLALACEGFSPSVDYNLYALVTVLRCSEVVSVLTVLLFGVTTDVRIV